MKYLGLDWGLKKIGLAVSSGEIASPFGSLQVSGFEMAVKKVSDLVKSEAIDEVVIGKPEGNMGKAVDKVTKALRQAGISVAQTDETLSTQDAKKMMIEMNFPQKARADDNEIAAAIILQRFLDEK